MKFQESSFNGLNVTVGTESVTHAPTHARTHPGTLQKQYAPSTFSKLFFFQSWGHKQWRHHFLHFKSMRVLFRFSRTDNSIIGGPICPKFELLLDIMHVLDIYDFKMNTRKKGKINF